MTEIWKPIEGYAGRYEVSTLGRVKAVPFQQRYLLRNGIEAHRKTREKIIAQQVQNAGYLLVHLHLDNKRTALLVHRLVAQAFCAGEGAEVNHIDGRKANNAHTNLEWVTRTRNHDHAVDIGLNVQAITVRDPGTGAVFPSIARAARLARKSHRTVRATFERAQA